MFLNTKVSSSSKDPTCEKARVGLQCGQCAELPRGPLELFKDSEAVVGGVALHADEEIDVSHKSCLLKMDARMCTI